MTPPIKTVSEVAVDVANALGSGMGDSFAIDNGSATIARSLLLAGLAIAEAIRYHADRRAKSP